MATRTSSATDGVREIRTALGESRRLFVSIGLFSAFVNLLMLTGPLFMLQVYDRVLTSRSEATLVALIGIVAFLFLTMGLLDHARARVLARAGARFQARMDPRVLGAILTRAGRSPQARSTPATGLHDLEAMQRFASGPGPFAFFDAPWTPAFLFVLFTFHWLLGVLAFVSGLLLVGLALLNSARTSRLQTAVGESAARAGHFVEQLRAGAETVRGLGMRAPATARAGALRRAVLKDTVAVSDRGGAYAVTSRTLRLFLQSMMLGLGAWLAIQGEVTSGIMIAAAILLGRALAPIDQAVGQWPVLQRALQGRRSLANLLRETPEEPERTPLPAPKALLEAENLVVAPPGARVPAVRGVSFRLDPGHAIGIAGPSASGKSTLAKALAGVWPPMGGKATLGGAALDQYGEQALARHLGWLPQEVVLFEGTVAENIARLAPEPEPGGGGRGGDVGGRARDDPRTPRRLRLPGGGRRRRALGRAAPAHRARPCVLRRPGGGGARRAGRASRRGGRRSAQPGHCGAEGAGRGGGDRGPPSRHLRRMRRGTADGEWPDAAGRGASAGPRRAPASAAGRGSGPGREPGRNRGAGAARETADVRRRGGTGGCGAPRQGRAAARSRWWGAGRQRQERQRRG